MHLCLRRRSVWCDSLPCMAFQLSVARRAGHVEVSVFGRGYVLFCYISNRLLLLYRRLGRHWRILGRFMDFGGNRSTVVLLGFNRLPGGSYCSSYPVYNLSSFPSSFRICYHQLGRACSSHLSFVHLLFSQHQFYVLRSNSKAFSLVNG